MPGRRLSIVSSPRWSSLSSTWSPCSPRPRPSLISVAIGVADEVQGHPFDEELRALEHVPLVERVQHGVPGAIGRAAAALHRFLAEVRRVAAERTLVDRAVLVAVEGHAEVLQLDHDF